MCVCAQIAFVGFYNAMVINAERTAAFFCEAPPDQPSADATDDATSAVQGPRGGRCGRYFERLALRGGCCGRFWFSQPAHGVRRAYSLVIAILECGLVSGSGTLFPSAADPWCDPA